MSLCSLQYAFRKDEYIYTPAPVLLDEKSQVEPISGVNVGFHMKDKHVFM